MSTAYYNEFDKFAAEWLRELIKAGLIAPGIVDDRSIEDVTPNDLRGFTQHHFFAGIGVWSYALRNAGWPDDRQIWTASCPCQPFSAAGKGDGFTDERHLWPALHHLIQECRPSAIVGEQVASKDAGPWIDLIHSDLEALGYAFGCVPFPSAGVGAPHIRDRLYWVAYCDIQGLERRPALRERADQRAVGPDCLVGGVADHLMQQRPDGEPGICLVDDAGGRLKDSAALAGFRCDSGMADANGYGSLDGVERANEQRAEATAQHCGNSGMADATGGQHITSGAWADQRAMACSDGAVQAAPGPTGPTNGHWADADWLFCRDGKWRPVEPGTFPLAHGAPARVGRLRGYGNAVNAKAAQVFIESLLK